MACDIVMPVWNQLESTRDCVDSISRNTSFYRIIIIDNASESRTRGFLDELKKRDAPRLLVIRNEQNLGFVKAANQGIRLCEAPYICVLNNDTLVTRGWLEEMVSVLEKNPAVGLLNPSSNTLGQRPAGRESIESYAQGLAVERGRFVELGSAIGFCMAARREVIDRIGLFDEIYGMGNFEDTDLSRRAINAGYICVRARGAYVWHEEGVSFTRSKEFNSAFARNRAIYESRWGKMKRILYKVSGRTVSSQNEYGSMLQEARAGNWVYIYAGRSAKLDGLPQHSNIVVKRFPDLFLSARVAFKILTKKKKFNEIREV